MQWIFMLAGLLLGAASDESLSGAIFGGLLGLVLAQALKMRTLGVSATCATQRVAGICRAF